MQKVMDKAELDATVLALAGITRLNFKIAPEGKLLGDAVPAGLLATVLDLDVMLPCVGQGAIGIEVRADDERINASRRSAPFWRRGAAAAKARWGLTRKSPVSNCKCGWFRSCTTRCGARKPDVRSRRQQNWAGKSRLSWRDD
jgi:hypothetical protein